MTGGVRGAAVCLALAVWANGAVTVARADQETSGDSNPPRSRVLVLAHRGLSARAPENSLAAFREALEAGADGSELDVRLCKSGEVVVLHDDVVDRVSNGHGFVAEMTLDELERLRLDPDPAGRYTLETIPTLEDVLEALGGRSVLFIEMKRPAGREDAGDRLEEEVGALIDRFDLYDSTFVSSLNPAAVAKIERAYPRVRTVFEYIKGDAEGRPRAGWLDVAGKPDGVGPNIKTATPAFARWARDQGFLTSTFSPFTIEEMEKAVTLGFDIVQTHRPSICRLVVDGKLGDDALAVLEPLVLLSFDSPPSGEGCPPGGAEIGEPRIDSECVHSGSGALALTISQTGGMWTDLPAAPEALFYLTFWVKIEESEKRSAFESRIYLIERSETLAGAKDPAGPGCFHVALLGALPEMVGLRLHRGPRYEALPPGALDGAGWMPVRLPLRTGHETRSLRLVLGTSGMTGRIILDDLTLWRLPSPEPARRDR